MNEWNYKKNIEYLENIIEARTGLLFSLSNQLQSIKQNQQKFFFKNENILEKKLENSKSNVDNESFQEVSTSVETNEESKIEEIEENLMICNCELVEVKRKFELTSKENSYIKSRYKKDIKQLNCSLEEKIQQVKNFKTEKLLIENNLKQIISSNKEANEELKRQRELNKANHSCMKILQTQNKNLLIKINENEKSISKMKEENDNKIILMKTLNEEKQMKNNLKEKLAVQETQNLNLLKQLMSMENKMEDWKRRIDENKEEIRKFQLFKEKIEIDKNKFILYLRQMIRSSVAEREFTTDNFKTEVFKSLLEVMKDLETNTNSQNDENDNYLNELLLPLSENLFPSQDKS